MELRISDKYRQKLVAKKWGGNFLPLFTMFDAIFQSWSCRGEGLSLWGAFFDGGIYCASRVGVKVEGVARLGRVF